MAKVRGWRHTGGMGEREKRHDRLFDRAYAILEGRRNGHALPILRLLSARNYPLAMNILVDFVPPRTRLKLQRRAAATGDSSSLFNMAVERRNRGDMQGYRYWLARAARVDPGSRDELQRFRIRFPYPAMKRWRRYAAER